ncbi:MAG TPA: dephospho-CoA kinase [Mycobacteriales bacterium]|nr:dephospho-CoA kinase [Mycobacteriales bacterium]
MVTIGLTGGIGAGKSVVARLLARHGAVVVDADLVAREVVAPGSAGLARLVAEFGREVLDPSGALDRGRLAGIVFADPVARARLNAIVHPLVAARTAELFAAVPPDVVVVHDVPLLVENGLAPAYPLVLVVEASEPVRLARLADDRGMTEQAARDRMAAQASDADRRAVADLVIQNDGDLAELAARVDAMWRDHVLPLAGRGCSRGVRSDAVREA